MNDAEASSLIILGACPSNRRGPFYYSDRLLAMEEDVFSAIIKKPQKFSGIRGGDL
jgi:hypothetical protein